MGLTREEALLQVANSEILERLIKEIYDDFESRTCETCASSSYEMKFGELEFNSCFRVSNGNECKWEAKR